MSTPLTEEEQKSLDWWQSCYPYKRPIIPSEFIDAFLSKAQEKDIDQIRISGQLNPRDEDFGCLVELLRRKQFQGAPGRLYDLHVARFRLGHMPGCGGVLLSHGSYVAGEQRGKGLGTLMQEMKMWIAGRLEVGQLLATVIVGNEGEEGLLEKHGWMKIGQPFRNPHTQYKVQMWQRILV